LKVSFGANPDFVKARIKQFIAAHPALGFLLPVGQFVLGLPYRLRNAFFRELLRWQLIGLWLRERRPLLLFARFGGIGDILCSLPAYAALCRQHPGTPGVFITLAEFKCLPVLAGAPGVVCPALRFSSVPKFPRWLVAQTVVPQYADELGRPSGSVPLVEEFYLASGLEPAADRPRFDLAADPVEKIRASLQFRMDDATRTVVIHPGPSWPVKEWPAAHWRALVAGLKTSSSVRIFQIGAHRHCTLGQIAATTVPGVESLVDRLSLAEIAALLTVADLFIGIDSGMLHLAEAAGTPCVGIFGPTNPARILSGSQSVGLWQPLPCSFCHHRQPRLHFQTGCPHDIACLGGLRPEIVLAQCRVMLQEEKRKSESGNDESFKL
jgi:ADP-heptose:LPS heptosyltransferase